MRSKPTTLFAALLLVAALGACRDPGEKVNDGAAGLPGTETTDTNAQTSTTTTASATTTASTGGTSSNMVDQDKTFVSKAGMIGLAEVQMGNLGVQKATNAAVKAFAQRMVTDHSASNSELSTLATAKGLALPTELDSEHKGALEHLNGMSSGAEFDKMFMQHMVQDHQKAVTEFQNASTGAQDSDVKGFAAKNLPILQDHLRQAQEISSKL